MPEANMSSHGMTPRPRPFPSSPLGRTAPSALDVQVPRRGWPDAQVWADTGPLLGLAGLPGLLDPFLAHVEGRLLISSIVVNEIKRLAQGGRNGDDPQLARSARVVLRVVLQPGRAKQISPTADDFVVIDRIKEQIDNMPSGRGAHPQKNMGEAATIAACIGEKSLGTRVLMLSNDRDGRAVAAWEGIPVRDIGGVLQELVCAGLLQADYAFQCYESICEFSSPPGGRLLRSPTEMQCLGTAEWCRHCRALG